ELATGELVLFLDSDLDLHPRQFLKFFEIFEKEKADIVIGCKRHPDSTLHYPPIRRFISFVYFTIIRILFDLPINDTQTGMKLFKYKTLEKIFPRILVKRFAFDLEILVNAHYLGYNISQAPVVVDVKQKFGFIRPKHIYITLLDTLAIYYRLNILKYYDRPIRRLTSRPLVSIIIPVQKYSSYLKECINYCLQLNYDNFEIIILPDEKIDLFDTLVSVIPTGKASPALKRDIGLKYAKGEIIAFIDDDAYPDKNWLNAVLPYFSDENIAAVGGPAVTADEDNLLQKCSGYIYASYLVGGPYSYRYIPKTARQVEDYPTVNLLVRKSDLESMGGFQTEFWPGEDTILCLKIIEDLKKKIIYEP
ncbi:MAG: glycosyltransferase, partial [Candidatus Omnitrophica bacterium]|nr:glycosyltransferase [Candidatus Omnitrophota bacterium]